MAAAAVIVGATSDARAQSVAECVDYASQGQTVRDSGHLLEARQLFAKCASMGCPDVIRADCAQWHAEVEQRTPTMAVRPQAAGVDVVDGTVTVDGVEVPVGRAALLDPGKHVIFVRHGDTQVTQEVVLAEGELGRVVVIELSEGNTRAKAGEPTGDAPERTHRLGALRVTGIVAAGVGVVGLGLGTAFGLRALSKDDLAYGEGHCDETRCDPIGSQARRDALDSATVSTVSFVAGGLLLVGGVAMYLLSPRGHAASARSGARHDALFAPRLDMMPGADTLSMKITW